MDSVTEKSSTRKTTPYILTDTEHLRKPTQAEAQSLLSVGTTLVFVPDEAYQPLIIRGFEC